MTSPRWITPSSATDLWAETTISIPGRRVPTSRTPEAGSFAPPGAKSASYSPGVTARPTPRPRPSAPEPPHTNGVSPLDP